MVKDMLQVVETDAVFRKVIHPRLLELVEDFVHVLPKELHVLSLRAYEIGADGLVGDVIDSLCVRGSTAKDISLVFGELDVSRQAIDSFGQVNADV